MRGAVPLVLVALAVGFVATSTVYVVNPTIAEVKIGNETIKIGVKDVIDTIVNQIKPSPTYEHTYDNTEILNITKQFDGKELPENFKDIVETFGNSVSLCFTKENIAYCVNVSAIDNTIVVNKHPAERTIYIDYELKDNILQAIENKDYNKLVKIAVEGIKSGKIKGISIQDLQKLIGSI